MTRLRAFLIHLSGSALLGFMAVALVFLVWYPTPFHKAAGVTTIFLILIGVDIVIGPMLTLMVFNPHKKSLRFDITTIVLLQLAAFGYGMWTVGEGRPGWLVFNVDRFDLVRVNEIDLRAIAQARPEYQSPSWFGPTWVSATQPADPMQRKAILFEAAIAKIDVAQRPERYSELETEAKTMAERARPIDQLLSFNAPEVVENLRRNWPQADGWLPMAAKSQDLTVLINTHESKIIAVVDARPW